MDITWFIDSGATNHVTPDPGNMSQSTEYMGKEHLTVGNGNSLPITHTGFLFISPNTHTNTHLKLKQILCVPKITKNLLSISKIT